MNPKPLARRTLALIGTGFIAYKTIELERALGHLPQRAQELQIEPWLLGVGAGLPLVVSVAFLRRLWEGNPVSPAMTIGSFCIIQYWTVVSVLGLGAPAPPRGINDVLGVAILISSIAIVMGLCERKLGLYKLV